MPQLTEYLLTCGFLLLPAIAWNIALARRLPPAYQEPEFSRSVSQSVRVLEHITRLVVFLLPFAMPLEIRDTSQKLGLAIFIVGTLFYFASWLALIGNVKSAWSTSRIGFLAPAYTPLIWLVGIALVGQRLLGADAYRWWYYLLPSVAFLTIHIHHANAALARSRASAGA